MKLMLFSLCCFHRFSSKMNLKIELRVEKRINFCLRIMIRINKLITFEPVLLFDIRDKNFDCASLASFNGHLERTMI
jgi:hypothetical protein